MAANSEINPLLVDNTFPIPNKSQSSQGFRTNWVAIQNNFTFAKSDILNLQNKKIAINGDIVGTSNIFDSGSSDIEFSVSLQPTGLQDLQPGTYTTSLTNNISFTIDNRGLITEVKENAAGNVMPSDGTITSTSTVDKTKAYPGTTTLNIPSIEYNKYGQITNVTNNLITGFGITQLYMPKNSILFGDSSNSSNFLSPPSENSFLYFNGQTLIWQDSYVITNINDGNMISTSYSNNTIGINVDYSTLSILDSIENNAMISVYDGNNYNLLKIDTITESIADNTLNSIKIVKDTSPQLGGNLDLNGYVIENNKNGIVQLQSDNINLIGNKTIKLNSLSFPISLPTTQSIFSIGTDGTISYQTLSNYNIDFMNKLTSVTITNNQALQMVSTDSLHYSVISNNISNMTLIADNTNYNTNTSYSLKYSIYFEVTNSDLIVNLAGGNNESIYLSGDTTITSLTLSQGYIYKIELEYYSNSKWLISIPFKSQM